MNLTKTLGVLFIITSISTSRCLAFPTKEQHETECEDDENCQVGKSFCQNGYCSGSCIPCELFNREKPISGCAKTEQECGACKPGTQAEENTNMKYGLMCRVIPETNSTTVNKEPNIKNVYENDETSGSAMIVIIVLAILLVIAFSLAMYFFCRHPRKKKDIQNSPLRNSRETIANVMPVNQSINAENSNTAMESTSLLNETTENPNETLVEQSANSRKDSGVSSSTENPIEVESNNSDASEFSNSESNLSVEDEPQTATNNSTVSVIVHSDRNGINNNIIENEDDESSISVGFQFKLSKDPVISRAS